eukprot:CAMPEP_0113300138 /NCGR_PEP_ID=MMETSP0010_2-20120614/1889_1 /TAXON_ID=216773 ORGANISM="Corethron hystrix, Strain 308" /NCGR_SAMPLE_ID=MMETSP0010_2 /ASSEMBLY_ACC=CAM_ASM_000155 /LENGTH=374 /DNA_ID=CAMNT_0000153505 /DNA_START=147 /DNA_END=1268 /DNA_ORIENTATION=+ /assembly_acc=CAM_ASM_000155
MRHFLGLRVLFMLHILASSCVLAAVDSALVSAADLHRRLSGSKIVRIMPTQYAILSHPFVRPISSHRADASDRQQHCMSVSSPPRMFLTIVVHAPDLSMADAHRAKTSEGVQNSLGGEPPLAAVHRRLSVAAGAADSHGKSQHIHDHKVNKHKLHLEEYKQKLAQKVSKLTQGGAGSDESRQRHRKKHNAEHGGADPSVGDVRIVIRERGDLPVLSEVLRNVNTSEETEAERAKTKSKNSKYSKIGKMMLHKIMGQAGEMTHVLTEKIETIHFKTELGGTVDICARSLSASKYRPSRIGLDVSMSSQEPKLALSESVIPEDASLTERSSAELLRDLKHLHSSVAEVIAEADHAKSREVLFHHNELEKHTASFWW